MQTIDLAKEELKRVDHMFYVSLKYTRTCDVIRNIINRMIESYNYVFSAILEELETDGKISEIPGPERLKAELVLKFRKNHKEFVQHYFLLRKIFHADFDRREEYRKHVTLLAKFGEDAIFEIDVPLILEYYKKVIEYIKMVEEELK
jgi:hypothetical protein